MPARTGNPAQRLQCESSRGPEQEKKDIEERARRNAHWQRGSLGMGRWSKTSPEHLKKKKTMFPRWGFELQKTSPLPDSDQHPVRRVKCGSTEKLVGKEKVAKKPSYVATIRRRNRRENVSRMKNRRGLVEMSGDREKKDDSGVRSTVEGSPR